MEDIEIFFDDMTIAEAACDKDMVEKLMNEDIEVEEWMLESMVALTDGLRESAGIIQFWNNGEAILIGYESGFYDETVPIDAIYLKEYVMDKGWDFVLTENLVESNREFWDRFLSIFEDDNISHEKEDIDLDEEDYEYSPEDDFLEHSYKMKEYKKPTANKYNIFSLDEFKDHEYDMKKREEREDRNKF